MVKVNRWGALAAGCLIQASSGLNYSFSILAPSFKDWLGFSDGQLGNIAGSISLGGYLAIPSGLLYDRLQHRHNLGPRLVIWVGCVLMAIGYGGMWLQAAGLVKASFGRMLLCGVLSGNAGTWWDTSVLVTSVRNFPDDRGSVLGILKAFLGLSTSIYASMYWALFAAPPGSAPSSPTDGPGSTGSTGGDGSSTKGPLAFVAVLALAPSLLNFLGSLFMNQVPAEYHEHESQPLSPDTSGQPTGEGNNPSTQNTMDSSLHKGSDGNGLITNPRLLASPAPHPQALGAREHAETMAMQGQQQAVHSNAAVAESEQHYHHQHHHHRHVNKGARFLGLYVLISVVAILQAGSTLAGQGQTPGSEVEKLHAAVLLVLLCLVLLLPASAGPLIRQSLRHSQTSASLSPTPEPQQNSCTTGPQHGTPATASQHLQPERVPLLEAACPPDENDGQHVAAGRSSRGPYSKQYKRPFTPPVSTLRLGQQARSQPLGGGTWQADARSPRSPSCPELWQGCPSEGESEECESDDIDEEEAPPVQSMTAGKALWEPTFWALFLSLLAASASGLTLLNNLAPLVISLGGQKGGQVACVSLFSVANASGRLLFGHLSEHYLHRCGLPRPLFVLLASGIMTLCMAVLALGAQLHMLYGLSLAIGLAFGGHWSAIPAVATDLFGLDSFAGIYCCLQFSPAVGVLAIASWLVGRNLSEAARAQGGTGDCVGLECFAATWRVLLLLDVGALVVVLWLWQRTRASYRVSHAAAAAGGTGDAGDVPAAADGSKV